MRFAWRKAGLLKGMGAGGWPPVLHADKVMPMTEEQVMLGAAMMLLKRHGDLAPLKVAERIGVLVVEGDEMGIAVWRAIAGHMDAILRAGPMQ